MRFSLGFTSRIHRSTFSVATYLFVNALHRCLSIGLYGAEITCQGGEGSFSALQRFRCLKSAKGVKVSITSIMRKQANTGGH